MLRIKKRGINKNILTTAILGFYLITEGFLHKKLIREDIMRKAKILFVLAVFSFTLTLGLTYISLFADVGDSLLDIDLLYEVVS